MGVEIDEILAKKEAVEKIAKRYGFAQHQAEDIAQDAVVSLLQNEKLKSQKHYYSFIDSLREGIDTKYRRSGRIARPIFENEFAKSDVLEQAGKRLRLEQDFDGREEYARNSCGAAIALSKLKPRTLVVFICYFVYGLTFKEIAERMRVSEARIHQMIKAQITRFKQKAGI